MHKTANSLETFDKDIPSFTPVQLQPGMFLGENQNYRLEKCLGAGTFGQAWLADEIEGGNKLRKVVCKILPALVQKEKAEMEKVIKTFQLVQPLTHQYICPIYALKSDPKCGYFFVMAYADGGTLWDWYVSQPNYASGLPVSQVVEMLRPVAMALDHAHSVGVVHRDVKPQNILLATLGKGKVPWLCDFSISAQIHRTITQTSGTHDRAGTPAYMAPEQCFNQKLDGQTDQYALGVLAYLFLSGRLPFDADDPVALWGQIVYTPVPTLKNVPESVNAVVQRALAKKREERFGSCVEFIDALQAPVVPDHPVTQTKKPIVSKNITVPGTFVTLEEACEKAPDGAFITIKPGKYELSKTIVLSRTITLRGETGFPEDVVIECPNSRTFQITGGSPLFQNLTANNRDVNRGGFYITGGTPKLFRCIITSRKGAGMAIEGKEANPEIEKCIIKDCGTAGLIVEEQGRGEFKNCEVYGNACAGIQVWKSGNPTVIGCKIHDGKAGGLLVCQEGRGEFRDCDIYGNASDGIYVEDSGNPTVKGCKIHDGKLSGVLVWKEGLGKFYDCDIYQNSLAEIYVVESGNPTITRCNIHDGKQCGVYVLEKGLGKFHNCDINGNVLAGIYVEEAGNPTFTGCKIHDGKQNGVFVSQKGLGEFRNCDIYENASAGIYVQESGNPTVTGCKIHNGKGEGIAILKKGRGEFSNCDICRNSVGIVVDKLGNPIVTGCKIHHHVWNGVSVVNGGRGQFRNCEVYQNKCPGFYIGGEGDPTVNECKIHDGKQNGVYVFEKGRGKFRNCEIYGNKYAAISVTSWGNPTFSECKIHDGKSNGVNVFEEGRGKFCNCEIYGNDCAGIVVCKSGNPTVTGCKIHDQLTGVNISEKGMGTFNNNTFSQTSFVWEIFEDAGVVKGYGNNPKIKMIGQ
ncbi:MAG: right-handed parallel beta-helix repeat-containing protein [Thermoguttaceae bacterium]|nr:right-handed parallel beta-helix repeat-containing protein [Thermoguttaceae bacterium]